MTESQSEKKVKGEVGRVEIEGVRWAKGEVARKDWERVTVERVRRVPCMCMVRRTTFVWAVRLMRG